MAGGGAVGDESRGARQATAMPEPEPEPELEQEPESEPELPELGVATSESDSDLEVGEAETTKWADDDEAVMTSDVNDKGGDTQRDKRASTQMQELTPEAFAARVGRMTELEIDPMLLDLDEDESKRALMRAKRYDGYVGKVRKWWAARKVERNKKYGMDPYIRARLGRHAQWVRTDCIPSTMDDQPEVYTSPKFNDSHNRFLCLQRSSQDGGELIVEAMDERADRDRFIGGCHVHLSEFIRHAEKSTNWKHTMFHLYDKQEGEAEDAMSEHRDAGGVHALVRWIPECDEQGMWLLDEANAARGELHMKIMTATGLRDVSGMKISDIDSFADKSALYITTSILVVAVMVSQVYYHHFLWEDVDWDARGVDFPALDVLLFVLTTFTTVGFGNNPPIHGSGRMVTSIYVIAAIGILGVFIGAFGDVVRTNLKLQKKKQLQKRMREMEAKGENTSNLTRGDAETLAKDLAQEAEHNLKKRHKLAPTQSDAAKEWREEMVRVLERHFWIDEARKAGLGFAGLMAIVVLGTVMFAFTEREQCFPTRLGTERAEALLATTLANSSEWFKLRDEIMNCSLRAGCAADPWRGECDAGKVQGIGVFGAAYMTVVTASTVGYGDLTPQSSIGKLIGILYFPAAVALMSKTILAVSMIPSEYRQLKLEEYVLDQFGEQLTVADLEDLRQSVNITSADEGIRKNDFTLAMLMRLGRVSKVDMLRTEQVFFNLDKDHSGEITMDDVHGLIAIQRRRMAAAHEELKRQQGGGHNMPVMPQHFTPTAHLRNHRESEEKIR